MSQSIYIIFKKKQLDLDVLNVSQKLGRTVHLPEIINILVKDLPGLGIEQAFLVLYDTPPAYIFPQEPPETSRLILALNNGRDMGIPESGIKFPTKNLLPEKYLQMIGDQSVIVEALHFQEMQIGYFIFQAVLENKTLYTILQTQLSSSIQGALLIKKGQENAQQLKEANDKIQSLNKILNEENLEMRTEIKTAERIQTALLPRQEELDHRDLEISGFMYPAKEAGGDYYDVINDKNSCLWLGIGDVSGHGITPGLVMMTTQTMHSLITRKYAASPRDVVILINSILHKNVTEHLEESKFLTFTSLKYLGNGRFQFAGLQHVFLQLQKPFQSLKLINR